MDDEAKVPVVEEAVVPQARPGRWELKAAEAMRLHAAQQAAEASRAEADRVAHAAQGLLGQILEGRGARPRPGAGYRLELEGDEVFLVEVLDVRG